MDRSIRFALPRLHRKPSIWRRFLNLTALSRQRQTLAQLDDSLLRDVGLTPDQARAEAARPIWDVPQHWRM